MPRAIGHLLFELPRVLSIYMLRPSEFGKFAKSRQACIRARWEGMKACVDAPRAFPAAFTRGTWGRPYGTVDGSSPKSKIKSRTGGVYRTLRFVACCFVLLCCCCCCCYCLSACFCLFFCFLSPLVADTGAASASWDRRGGSMVVACVIDSRLAQKNAARGTT